MNPIAPRINMDLNHLYVAPMITIHKIALSYNLSELIWYFHVMRKLSAKPLEIMPVNELAVISL